MIILGNNILGQRRHGSSRNRVGGKHRIGCATNKAPTELLGYRMTKNEYMFSKWMNKW